MPLQEITFIVYGLDESQESCGERVLSLVTGQNMYNILLRLLLKDATYNLKTEIQNPNKTKKFLFLNGRFLLYSAICDILNVVRQYQRKMCLCISRMSSIALGSVFSVCSIYLIIRHLFSASLTLWRYVVSYLISC